LDKGDQNKLKELENELDGKVKEIEEVMHQHMRHNNTVKKEKEHKKESKLKQQNANKMCLS